MEINHLEDVRQFARFDTKVQKLTLQFNVKVDFDVTSISQHLTSFKELTNLNLFIEGCQEYESKHFEEIYKLVDCTQLQELSINTGLSNNFGDEAAVYLAMALQNQTELTTLVLRLEAYNTITEAGVNVVLESLKSLKKLTSFSFYLEEDNRANASTLALLGAILCQNTKLSYVHLQFGSDTVVDSEGWVELGDRLRQLKEITTFILSIGQNNHVGVGGIKSLYGGVGAQSNLSVLRVKLAWHNDTRDGALSFAGDALRHTPQLKQLRLRISDWNAISEEALIKFSGGLATLTHLKHIHLQLGHLTDFTSHGTSIFADSLRHLTELTKLDLQVGSKSNFNGEAVTALANSVSMMPDLETLRLHIDCGNEAQASSLEQLGKSMAGLLHLKEVRVHYQDAEACSGELLLDVIAPFQKANSLQDMLLTVGDTERIHLRTDKQLTFSFKSVIGNQAVQKFLATLHQLGSNIQKLKIDARSMSFSTDDVTSLMHQSSYLPSLNQLKIRIRKVKSQNAVSYLEMFECYLKNQHLQQISIDIGENVKIQYIRPQESKKTSKKQKQVGSQLLLQIEANNKLEPQGGVTLITRIIKAQSTLIKEINLKIEKENQLTKAGLEELAYTLNACPYLSKLSFDVTETSEDLKSLIPKLKGHLEQQIKDKKNIVNTYYAAMLKQYELISSHLSPDMLNDVSTYLMKIDGTEKNGSGTTVANSLSPQIMQLGGLFQSNQKAFSDSSFNDEQEDAPDGEQDQQFQVEDQQYGEEEE